MRGALIVLGWETLTRNGAYGETSAVAVGWVVRVWRGKA